MAAYRKLRKIKTIVLQINNAKPMISIISTDYKVPCSNPANVNFSVQSEKT